MRKSKISYRKRKVISKPATTTIPSWFIKSLAWAFIIGGLGWAGYLQGGFDSVKTTNGQQDVVIAEQKKEVEAINEKINTHLSYMRESLARIEAQLKEKK